MGFAFPKTPDTDQRLLEDAHDRLPDTFGASIGAAVSDPTLRPTELLATQMRLNALGGRRSPVDRGAVTPRRRVHPAESVFNQVARDRGEDAPEDQPVDPDIVEQRRRDFVGEDMPDVQNLTPFVSPEALTAEYGELGLTFDRPMRRAEAEARAEIKREEIARHDVLARAPRGIGPGAARLGVSFIAAAIDPLNIASAFVPVVGPTRYAAWLQRYGATRARAARGGVEGFAGSAMIEPFVAGLSLEQQRDYTMADALLNLSIGTALGSALQAGGGKVADMMRARSPQAREAALRAALAQAMRGETIDVEPVVRAEQPGRARDRVAEAVDGEASRVAARLKEAAESRRVEVAENKAAREAGPPDLIAFLRDRGGVVDRGGDLRAMGAVKQRPGLVNNQSGLSLDDAALAAWEAGYFADRPVGANGERPTIDDLLELLDRNLNGERVLTVEDAEIAAAREADLLEETGRLADEDRVALERAADDLGLDIEGLNDRDLMAAVDAEIDERAAMMAGEDGELPSRERILELARRADNPEHDATADFGALEEINRAAEELETDDFLADVQADIDRLMAERAALMEAGGADPLTARFSELDAQVRELSEGARAGAACFAREA